LGNKEILNIQLASIGNESAYSDRKNALFFIHSFDYNTNGFRITEELCSAINPDTGKPYYDSLNNAPLVAITDGVDLGGHEPVFDKDGNIIDFETNSIGTLFDAHIGTHEINGEEKYGLWASGTLWLRFAETLNVIEKIYNTYGSVDTSVEVMVGGYEFSEEGKTAINSVLYFGHCLLGVSKTPAYADSGMYEFNLQIAEAFKQDIINSSEGGNKVNVEFNFGKEIINQIETSTDLSFDDIREGIWKSLNNEVDSDGNIIYQYWIDEVYLNYVIVTSNETRKNYKVSYTISENNEVIVDMSTIVEVQRVWLEISAPTISELESQIVEKDNKIAELNNEIEKLNGELKDKQDAIEMNSSEANNKIISLGKVVQELQEQLNSLEPIKKEYDRVREEIAKKELNEKRENLKQYALNSKMISEQDLEENETLKTAITELNENTIKAYIADCIVNSYQFESNNNEDIVVNVQDPKPILPSSIKEEMYMPRKR
jgi:hypothetical protein